MNPIPAFDLHCDLFLRVLENDVDIASAPEWVHASLPNLEAGGVTEQVFAIWVKEADWPGERGVRRAHEMLDVAHRDFQRHAHRMAFVTTMAEADVVRASGRIAAFLWLEGGAPLCDEPDNLQAFYDRGIRGMTLTWTTNLPWAGSCTDPEDPSRGLNDLGRRIIRRMNDLRMIVDISHTSERTTLDAMAVSSTPVIASHSGCRAIANTPRNVSDAVLREIANTGGLIGILAVPQFLSTDWEPAWDRLAQDHKEELAELTRQHEGGWSNPDYRHARCLFLQSHLPAEYVVSLETWLDHVEHAVNVAGVDHVGLGSDFDGYWSPTIGMENAACWQGVAQGLARRGFSPAEVSRIMGDNARRIFRQVLG